MIKYNKEIIKKDGRKLITGGPRDQQRRLREANRGQELLIEELRKEISQLKTLPSTQAPTVNEKLFSGEQVDNEIRKAVTEALEKKEKEINKLKKELEKIRFQNVELKSDVKSQEKLIEEKDSSLKLERERNLQLTAQLSSKDDFFVEKSDRPKMKKTFIDPLEKDSGEHLKPHIESKEVKVKEQNKIHSNIDKLRGLMGKLPNKD
jgi:hypothetical protein